MYKETINKLLETITKKLFQNPWHENSININKEWQVKIEYGEENNDKSEIKYIKNHWIRSLLITNSNKHSMKKIEYRVK